VTETVDRVKLRETRLLDSATRLFTRFGFDKTSVDDIARAAGVSKGAVYLHWPSKFSLFEAVLIRQGLGLLDDIVERLKDDPESGTLGSIYRHSILALGAKPLLMAVYTEDAELLGEYVRHQEPRVYAQRFLFGEEFVRRLQGAQLIRSDLEPHLTAYIMGVISFGLLSIGQLAPTVQPPPLAALADALADLVERGLGSGNRRARASGTDAFRILVDETRELYLQRLSSANGHQHR
jgi:TetR/AcrR family acrAB operon transcriptional repressor